MTSNGFQTIQVRTFETSKYYLCLIQNSRDAVRDIDNPPSITVTHEQEAIGSLKCNKQYKSSLAIDLQLQLGLENG